MRTDSPVAAVLIVRDEERLLPECLASVAPWVSELCVLDTGSTDASVEVARSFGAKVASFEWVDDFSAARNASLAMPEAPWSLVIDADERLLAATGPALLRAAATDRLAYYVTREDQRPQGAPDRLAVVRLFRNRTDIRFRRPVHEGIMDDLIALGAGELEDSGVSLTHCGYLPEVLRGQDKYARNLRILRQRMRDVPDDLYNVYKLAITLPSSAPYERRAAFDTAHTLALALSAAGRAETPFLSRLFTAHAASLAADGELGAALAIADQGIGLLPPSAELMCRRGELARCIGDVDAALLWLQRALAVDNHSLVRADRPHEVAAQAWAALLAISAESGAKSAWPPPEISADVRVACALVRLQFSQRDVRAALTRFAPLLESHFAADEVRLLAGEIAWRQRDFNTADSMWRLTNQESYAGHKAHAWLALSAVARGLTPAPIEGARDVSVAVLAGLLSRLSAAPLRSNEARLVPEAVASATARWRAELCHAGRADLAESA
jgi:Glycosyl transferase family 2